MFTGLGAAALHSTLYRNVFYRKMQELVWSLIHSEQTRVKEVTGCLPDRLFFLLVLPQGSCDQSLCKGPRWCTKTCAEPGTETRKEAARGQEQAPGTPQQLQLCCWWPQWAYFSHLCLGCENTAIWRPLWLFIRVYSYPFLGFLPLSYVAAVGIPQNSPAAPRHPGPHQLLEDWFRHL